MTTPLTVRAPQMGSQPSSTPATAVPRVNDMGGAVRGALDTGKKDMADHKKSEAHNEKQQELNAEAQEALKRIDERLKGKRGGTFADMLMEEMKISMDFAYVYAAKLHAKGFNGKWQVPLAKLRDLWKNRESQYEFTIDDVSKAVKVDDQGRISIADTVNLPFGKDKIGKDVEMSKDFQNNARTGLYGFLQREKCEVVETKDAKGKVLYAEVYKTDSAGVRKKLDRKEIETMLGADRNDYKAALETARSSPRP